MEEENVITYDVLYEILRREKFRHELQELDEDFFKKVVKYINEKKAIFESQKSKESVFSQLELQKTVKQYENIQKILTELYERRENKIAQLALFDSKKQERIKEKDMLQEEYELYLDLEQTLRTFREGIMNNLINGNLPKIIHEPKILKTEEKKQNNILIRFLHPVPKFVGEDLTNYGPFEAEDVANLPEKITDILISSKRAKAI